MKRESSLEVCPVCRASLPAPASMYGQAKCPRCEADLWHLALSSGPTFFVRRPGESIYDLMASLADPRHGFSAEFLEEALSDADPLDVVEILARMG